MPSGRIRCGRGAVRRPTIAPFLGKPLPKPYSQDLRDRVMAAHDSGQFTQAQLAERFRVSVRFIRNLLARRRQRGSYAALTPSGGPKARLSPQHKQRLRELVAQQPDATLAELKERSGAPVSTAQLCRTLQRLNLPRKKKPARC